MEGIGINSFILDSNQNQTKSIIKKDQRKQYGYFHVWFRGNSRFRVFHDDTDFIMFLTKCNKSAIVHDSIVTAFVLMDNHVHMQVYTKKLTPFITSLLIGYSQWFNKRKGLNGKLFEGPFSSAPIFYSDLLARNILYILTNPIRAGICKNIKDYRWSSYHSFKSEKNNHLNTYINVDNSVIKSLFGSVSELHKKAEEFIWNTGIRFSINTDNSMQEDNKRKSLNNNSEDGCENFSTSNWHKIPDYEIFQYLKLLLKGRKLNDISMSEFIKIVHLLKHNGGATIQQIASYTNESYIDIRNILRRF